MGFRPFVYREAVSEHLKGFVVNSSHGVEIEVEGQGDAVDLFLARLASEPPVMAHITSIDVNEMPLKDDAEFSIRSSIRDTERSTLISPDVSICEDCLREMNDPSDRRYRYPFINCTNCGPRYTIIQDIPYDRPKTTMSVFKMCPECLKEYSDPMDRRFHAQPNACSVCGPKIWISDNEGNVIDSREGALLEAARRIESGQIVAVKGLGGFHLACDAFDQSAVKRLRRRKGREEKPLAVMVPDLTAVERFALIRPGERDLLLSPRRPIVLLRKRREFKLADAVAPRNGYIGVMVAYTPLHILLLQQGFTALVMTSGNLSEEPIAVSNEEALIRLKHIADVFLMHDRNIHVRSDDSVVRIAGGLPRIIRRSRGYIPMPVFLRKSIPSVLAVGGELKNTICYTKDDRAFLSHHIGDLENLETLTFFEESVAHLKDIIQVKPAAVAHDLHPDYLSTQWALKQNGIERIGVQHHHAHIASCMAENGVDEKVIGLSLDGTGYGADGRIWGGEILIADLMSFERAAHFENRLMPGGSLSIDEPWRMGLSLLYTLFKNTQKVYREPLFLQWLEDIPFFDRVSTVEGSTVLRCLEKKFNTLETSSLGRLFDGVASVIGVRDVVAFEGQAAMELELLMDETRESALSKYPYPFEIRIVNGLLSISPDRMLEALLHSLREGISPEEISHRFHSGIVDVLVDSCRRIRSRTSLRTVALSGGCFQSRFLTEHLANRLKHEQFRVLTHTHVPANDGGIALGQAVIASYQIS